MFWFPPTDEHFAEVSALGAEELMQQHPSDPFRKMYYRAHRLFSPEEEAAIAQLRLELEHFEEKLFEGGDDA